MIPLWGRPPFQHLVQIGPQRDGPGNLGVIVG